MRECSGGETPLHIAAHNGHINAARALLACGANPNKVDSAGFTAIHEAAKEGHGEVVHLLLVHGSDPNMYVFDDCGMRASPTRRTRDGKEGNGAALLIRPRA